MSNLKRNYNANLPFSSVQIKFTLKGNSYKLQSDGDTVGRMRSSKKPFLSNKKGKLYYGGVNENNELNGIMVILQISFSTPIQR